MESKLSGVFTALVTPFRADGYFDEAAMRRIVERQLEAGVAGVVPCGTTGESTTLTAEEHQRVVATVVEAVAGHVHVIAGAGSNSLHHTLELSQRCIDVGANALLLVTPYYVKPTQHGLSEYYETLADATSVPLVLYNVPSRTGVSLTATTIHRLADHPQIVALKQATCDLDILNDLLYSRPSHFSVLAGEDSLALAMIAMGADGVISVVSNECPREMCGLVAAALGGHRGEAIAWQRQLAALMRANFVESNPIPVKFAMASMGLIANVLRSPMTPLSPQYHHQVIRALDHAESPEADRRMSGRPQLPTSADA